MIHIALTDDHAAVRVGIRTLIEREPDLSMPSDGGTLADPTQGLSRDCVDVLVLDLTMRGESGIEALPRLSALFLVLRRLVKSMHENVANANEDIQYAV